ncbi:hypothetical protein NFI96_011791 [Prochilodus magdalenae]|nr:hypothetical protein NFI96_011791 [Prochilodus magdalenae]
MIFAFKALCLVLAGVVCIQCSDAVAIPGRCECLKPSTRPYPWWKIKEFYIRPPYTGCKTFEIILTLNTHEQRCLSPELNQAKKLLECWNRKNKDGRKPLKISECQLRK